MILSTHFITGAAVASCTDSLLLIVILPLMLHFILDIIPHWEYMENTSELKNKIPHIMIDALAGPAIVLPFLIWKFGINYPTIIWLFVGGTISVIPDGLSLLHVLFPKNKPLKQIFSFHGTVHNKKMLSWKIGFPFQIALDLLAIILIILPKA